jgi:hypothetical protein
MFGSQESTARKGWGEVLAVGGRAGLVAAGVVAAVGPAAVVVPTAAAAAAAAMAARERNPPAAGAAEGTAGAAAAGAAATAVVAASVTAVAAAARATSPPTAVGGEVAANSTVSAAAVAVGTAAAAATEAVTAAAAAVNVGAAGAAVAVGATAATGAAVGAVRVKGDLAEECWRRRLCHGCKQVASVQWALQEEAEQRAEFRSLQDLNAQIGDGRRCVCGGRRCWAVEADSAAVAPPGAVDRGGMAVALVRAGVLSPRPVRPPCSRRDGVPRPPRPRPRPPRPRVLGVCVREGPASSAARVTICTYRDTAAFTRRVQSASVGAEAAPDRGRAVPADAASAWRAATSRSSS